ncbi:DUF1549 domain-containing protein [Gimesia aquarii]|uniref:Bacterial Ig-like domain (Group 2) n=1 Tax=Gimesia aquarii TaxID=2527964 RepID=A0A517WYL3_9PLAN|nr:DUF1549 domain-containing protein [Gimesia aquarii]QDU10345.1 Bacterial Ig-like domain (group 2) [Gimesia aquarii]
MSPAKPIKSLILFLTFTGLLISSINTSSLLASESEESVVLLPKKVQLSGKEARHRISFQKISGGNIVGPVSTEYKLSSSDPSVVKIIDDTLIPVSNGRATITATTGTLQSKSSVVVTNYSKPHQWSFRNDVQPILTKASCNTGACHGALAGKGGFRLSLKAFDDQGDFHTIAKQSRGRRIELSDPARSLILIKPTGAVPHKGGVRFETDSPEYRILSSWIAQGATPPSAKDPIIERIEVLPSRSILVKGQTQHLLVQAHYSDQSVRDVTQWTTFSSVNESVAQVDAKGSVKVTGFGEGAIVCIFSSKIAISKITSPYPQKIDPAVYAKSPQYNFIDELVIKQLKRLNLPPSPQSNDADFIRRIYIDTIGTLPTPQETETFLSDQSPDKRNKLIEQLLNRPEFIDYWTYKWSDLLLVNGALIRPQAVKKYHEWIKGHVKSNTPWDQMVRELITAQGSSIENGATNFYAIHQDPESMTENVSQAFLGLSIACAKCHNHPLEKWTNNQYYAMANFFSRVRAKGWGGSKGSGDGIRTLFVATEGDLVQPLTGKPQPPTPLDGEPIDINAPEDRRIYLANWLTSKQNHFFSRSITNRVWANFFGVGLVESVDDMRESNPASNEELLNAASNYLVKNNFDLKALMKIILQSAAYQRSSQPLPENKDEKRFYSRYYPRRMMAEVLLDSISQVTEVPDEFTKFYEPNPQKTDFYPKGTRAIQLYDSSVISYFLKTFGRNERMITCECERTEEPTMVQVLHISNGDTINNKLKAKESRVTKLMAAKKADKELVADIYMLCLSRKPTTEEETKLAKLLSETPKAEKRQAVEDLFWGILSSREFLFNH